MRRLTWLTLGLFALGCGGGHVVGLIGPDGSSSADAAPPLRGATDAPTVGEVAPPPPPPPVDAAVDLGRPIDAPPAERPVVVVDAAPEVPVAIPCQVANNNCPTGTYCLAPNCATGTCVAAPAASDVQAPVCGCDRLTYWNLSLAASNTASVRVEGACPAGIVCGGAAGTACPTGALCNLQQASAVACNINIPTGRCWVLPDTCPPAGAVAPTTRRCNSNNACQTVCALITAGRPYFVDQTCP
jgi:hypothetical protein